MTIKVKDELEGLIELKYIVPVLCGQHMPLGLCSARGISVAHRGSLYIYHGTLADCISRHSQHVSSLRKRGGKKNRNSRGYRSYTFTRDCIASECSTCDFTRSFNR